MESWEFQNNTSDLLLFKTDVFDMTPYIDDETGEESGDEAAEETGL